MCIKHKHTFPQARAHAHTHARVNHMLSSVQWSSQYWARLCLCQQKWGPSSGGIFKVWEARTEGRWFDFRSQQMANGGNSVQLFVMLFTCWGRDGGNLRKLCLSSILQKELRQQKSSASAWCLRLLFLPVCEARDFELQSTAAWCLSSMFMVHDLWLWFLWMDEEFVFSCPVTHVC